MTRTPAFWVVFVVASLAAALFSWRAFPAVYPIVQLDLRMDRGQALARADSLARVHQWEPRRDHRAAASFSVDDAVQTFVELEAGGKPAFARMVTGGIHQPYAWRVRRFREGDRRETNAWFTPAGAPWGFRQELEEKAPGAALPADVARRIAEAAATRDWGVELRHYAPVEAAQEVQPGGRVDHTFTYERPERDIGAGRYRLRLVVSGDRLTELTRFVKVPEAFGRRYAEMRSANEGIARGAALAMLVLYGVGGVGGGLVFLLRRRALDWRPALRWAALIAALQLVAGIGAAPLAWLGYDTAVPVRTFALQQGAALVAAAIATTAMLALSFMAAEGLTRLAFPRHPQLWRLWGADAGPTREVLGRTAAGYLLVGLFFAYQMALFFVSTRWWGWWNPSDALIQPDLLATRFPWLYAIALSAQAGFWEEALFRAVPLAGAALIGDRLGHRRAWIAVAFVLQAVVFGAGHANYPAQPAYARLVELTLPSFVFGGLYLAYGLLPAVVMHFVYDVVWFAVPLFTSDAPGIAADRLLVVTFAAVPLLVVVVKRARAGVWLPFGEGLRNAAWAPPEPAVVTAEAPAVVAPPTEAGAAVLAPPPRRAWPVLFLGAAGAAALAATAGRDLRMPRLRPTRAEAVAIAQRAIAAQGVTLPAGWEYLATVEAMPGTASRFTWQTAGRDAYRALLGRWINGPTWVVRAVTFQGDVAERAEEWEVTIGADGTVLEVEHQLPEARPGPAIAEDSARTLARAALAARLGIDPAGAREVSATPARLAARTDWAFVFADTGASPRLPQGELRARVTVSGATVTGASRYVFIPEAWERADRAEASTAIVFDVLQAVVLAGLLFGAVAAGVLALSRKRFPAGVGRRAFVVLGLLQLASAANNWPALRAAFSTAEPLELQVGLAVVTQVVVALLLAGLLTLVAGLCIRWTAEAHPVPPAPGRARWVSASALALAGVSAVNGVLAAGRAPRWPSYAAAGGAVPWLGAGLSAFTGWLTMALVLFVLFATVGRFTEGWTRRRLWGAVALVAAGMALGGVQGRELLPAWLASGALAGGLALAAWLLLVRHDLMAVPMVAAGVVVLGQVRAAVTAAYPGAAAGALLGSALVVAGAWWVDRRWRRASPRG